MLNVKLQKFIPKMLEEEFGSDTDDEDFVPEARTTLKKLENLDGNLLSEDDHSYWAPPYWNIMKETFLRVDLNSKSKIAKPDDKLWRPIKRKSTTRHIR